MLKEGWDVRNVTTVVGLRALRRRRATFCPSKPSGAACAGCISARIQRETVSVMGTPAFMEFVESIQSEGVHVRIRANGRGTVRHESLIVEVDTQNPEKDLDELDIPLPKLTRRFSREFKNLDALEPRLSAIRCSCSNPSRRRKPARSFSKRCWMVRSITQSTLDGSGPADYRSVVAFFARQLLKDLRLVGGYDVLYGKVKTFMREYLFSPSPVES